MRNWYRYVFLWHLRRRKEKLLMGIVWRLPKSLLYWAFVHTAVKMMRDNESPDSVSTAEILQRAGRAEWY